MNNNTQKHWFAARTRDKQEFAIRDALKKLGVDYFLPTQVVVRQLKYRKKKVEVPVIKNIIFVRATKQDACDIPNKHFVQLFYMKDLLTRSMLVVPDKQMDDFMRVMDLNPNCISFDNETLVVGSKVRVMKGTFQGIEGELASEANDTYVVIRIKGVLTASVKVAKNYLKLIEDDPNQNP